MPTPILMPALSPTMEEGTLAKWHVKEGDTIAAGDIIAEIETDKATMEFEAVDEGRIGKILIGDGTEHVSVNQPIGVLLEEGEDEAALEGYDPSKDSPLPGGSGGAAPTAKSEPKSEPEPAPKGEAKPASEKKPEPPKSSAAPKQAKETAPPAPHSSDGERVFASPLARRIAKEEGLDLTQLKGTGPRGRIVKADVEKALADGVGKAAPAGKAAAQGAAPSQSAMPSVDPRAYFDPSEYEEVPLDSMRRTIARRLTQSMQEIPHFYLTVDCKLDALLSARKEMNAILGEDGGKVSVNDILVRCAAVALMRVPEANVSFAGDTILRHKHADIGIAVALEGGLITPIIRKAEGKGLADIARESKDLAARARDKKLKPQEFEGGSFSISNLGMFGIREFTAVINPPQAAILAVGRGEERVIVEGGEMKTATMMTVTMSCDHRAIDGALGARFLDVFKGLVESPMGMLL